jgi:hypothetical protein
VKAAWQPLARTLDGPHQPGIGDHVALGRGLELLARRAGLQVELGVEGVKSEEVAVRPVARRWAGAAVARLTEAV